MTDPYKVLGVSSSATDEEITQAYRKKAKQFHPDLHPGDKNAEDKMKELNAAYDLVKKIRAGEASYDPTTGRTASYGQQQQSYGGYGGSYGPFGGGFGGFDDFFSGFGGRSQQQGPDSPYLRSAATYIQNGQYQQALHVLSEIKQHDAAWHYYSALANVGIGNRVTAMSHAREAARMEPSNYQYQSLLSQLEQGGSVYQQRGAGYGYNMNSAGKTLLQLFFAQALCYCCCRPC